jgi:molybdopterin molybdotransferase
VDIDKPNMLNFKEAQQIIAKLAASFGQEEIAFDEADGRVLAEDIYADRDYPPFNRSMMDGYAINADDWQSGIRTFKVQQIIYAGQSGLHDLAPGWCYKIMTGAPVPLSANAVIRREDAVEANGFVTFVVDKVQPYQSIARKGEDTRAGEKAIDAYSKCTPAVISLLATLGKSKILVEKLPQVALFTTGDEVVTPNGPVLANQIRNSNQYLLQSMLKKWLIKPVIQKHILDDKERLKIEL